MILLDTNVVSEAIRDNAADRPEENADVPSTLEGSSQRIGSARPAVVSLGADCLRQMSQKQLHSLWRSVKKADMKKHNAL